MRITETISTSPIGVEKSVRGDEIRVLTSCRAGKIVPVAFSPLLREDRVSRGSIRLDFKMAETIHPLMNAVNVTAYAHFVPHLALPEFDGMDSFNRSYQGLAEPGGRPPVQFFPTGPFGSSNHIWSSLGVHWPEGQTLNHFPVRAYNLIVNHRRAARSNKLPQRGLAAYTLAEAFWKNPNMAHIVPDFDQAMLDGEVPLTVNLGAVAGKLPVEGIGIVGSGLIGAQVNARQGIALPDVSVRHVHDAGTQSSATNFGIKVTGAGADMRPDVYVTLPEIFDELRNEGIKISLSNIELAKKTAAFAKLRQQYSGLDEDHLVDLLMEGIRVPDEALKQPILLDRKSTIFGYSERHAMDGASLDKSVTTGQTSLTLNFRTPPMNTGGIIMITVEIVPEQLFERMYDTYLGTTDPATLPNFLRDYLDPEKVEVVQNRFSDVMHSTPTGTFGYAPLNHGWKRSITRFGGRYRRPLNAGFVEDRQRFWSVERIDPKLTADFYMVGDLPHTVFMDSTVDPFEILALGNIQIVGNTVFGKTLSEDNGHYDAVMSQVDTSRIAQE